MRRFRSFLYILTSFLLGGGITLYVVWGKDYPFTQNSLYHIQITKSYIDQIWNLADLGILSHSYFKEYFIDQHFLFHLYLAPFLFVASPFLASKIAMSGLIAITTVLIQRVLRPSLGNWQALVISLIFLFFESPPLKRIFWERPAALNFIAIMVLILLYRNKANYWIWLLTGYVFSMVSFGTACLMAVLGTLLLLEKNKESLRALSFLGFGILASFLVTPFPSKKFIYFVELLFYNLFQEHSVGEWQEAPSSFGFIGPFVILFALSCLWLWKNYPSRSSHNMLMYKLALGTAILLPASWQISRLAYLFVFCSFLLFAMVLGEIQQVYRFGKKAVFALLIAILPLSLMQISEMKSSFRGDGRTARDVGDFPAWFRQSEFRNEPILLMSWVYWSPLFFHDATTQAEPGFSMFLYDHPANEVSRQLIRFWKNPQSLSWKELDFLFGSFKSRLLLVEKTHDSYPIISEKMGFFKSVFENKDFVLFRLTAPAISRYSQEDQICRASQKSSFADKKLSFLTPSTADKIRPWQAYKLKTYQSVILLLPESEQLSLESTMHPHLAGLYAYQAGGRFLWEPPSKSQSPLKIYRVIQCNQTPEGIFSSRRSLNPKTDVAKSGDEQLKSLMDLYVRNSTSEASPFPYYLGAQRGPEDFDKRTARQNLALWSLCYNMHSLPHFSSGSAYTELCHRGLKLSLENLQKTETSTLGEWVTLGLAIQEVADRKEFVENSKQIHEKILHFFLNKNFEIQGSDIIPYGQGLMYLLGTQFPHDLPVQKLLEQYWQAYEQTEKIFYIRWLAGSLTLAYKKWQNPHYLHQLNQLFVRTTQRYLSAYQLPDIEFCPVGEMNDGVTVQTPHHIAALLAEGFAQALATDDIGKKAQINSRQIGGLIQCALRLQVTPYNSRTLNLSEQQIGAIPYAYLNSVLRIDVQAHTALALGYYIRWLRKP